MLTILNVLARSRVSLNKHLKFNHLNRDSSRLISSLAILEQRDGKLSPISLRAITAAQKLSGPVTGFIAGSNIKEVAQNATMIQGLQKIIAVNNKDYEKV